MTPTVAGEAAEGIIPWDMDRDMDRSIRRWEEDLQDPSPTMTRENRTITQVKIWWARQWQHPDALYRVRVMSTEEQSFARELVKTPCRPLPPHRVSQPESRGAGGIGILRATRAGPAGDPAARRVRRHVAVGHDVRHGAGHTRGAAHALRSVPSRHRCITGRRPTFRIGQVFRKLSGRPGRGQSIATRRPSQERVTNAVARSDPPKQMLVV